MSSATNNLLSIGIDFGTSTSALACLRDGRPELVQDEQGDRVIPSIVQLTPEGEMLVGSAAKRGAVTFSDRTVQEVKRLMGTGETVTLGGQKFSPEEIAAAVLGHVKKAAESRFGLGNVTDVVLSVPARFENAAREATRRAAELAGLNVLRLINEPTAAALSYGIDHIRNRDRILVFDFGGGTLDVTILEMYDGVLDVKTSVGDDKLGGKDIDDLLIGYFREVYKEQNEKTLQLGKKNLKAAQMLKEEAEDAKKQLSAAHSVYVDVPFLTSSGGISLTLTRTRLDDLVAELVTKAMKLVEDALARAELKWSDIDVILPVGGSSRIPIFRKMLEQRWGRSLREIENPDEAVARGAAVAAGIEQQQFDAAEDIMILDVAPHRLGVATIRQVGTGQFIDDYFSEIIAKDAKLPAIQKRTYGTRFATRDTLSIRVYEAATDSNLCGDHRLITELPLRNITGGHEGENVEVEFRYTLDGTLGIAARYIAMPAVGAQETVHLDRKLETPDDLLADAEARKRCAPLLEQADLLMSERPELTSLLQPTIATLRGALDRADAADVQSCYDHLTEQLFELA